MDGKRRLCIVAGEVNQGTAPISMWMPTVQSGFPGSHGRPLGAYSKQVYYLCQCWADTDVERKKNREKEQGFLSKSPRARRNIVLFFLSLFGMLPWQTRPVLEILIKFPELDGFGHSSHYIVWCQASPNWQVVLMLSNSNSTIGRLLNFG